MTEQTELTREQMLALIEQLKKENNELKQQARAEKELERLTRSVQKKEKQLATLNVKLKDKTELLEQTKEQLASAIYSIGQYQGEAPAVVPNIPSLTQLAARGELVLQEVTKVLPALKQELDLSLCDSFVVDKIKSLVTLMIEEIFNLRDDNKALRARLLNKSSSESLKPTKKTKSDTEKLDVISKLAKQTTQITASLNAQTKRLDPVVNTTNKVLDSLSPEQDTVVTAAMRKIGEVQPPECEPAKSHVSLGRQKPKHQLAVTKVDNHAQSNERCRYCGETDLRDFGCLIEDFRTATTNYADILKWVDANFPVQFCPHCQHAHVVMEEGCDHPLFPNRTIGTAAVCDAAVMLSRGISLTYAAKALKMYGGLGNDTVSYNVKDFGITYLEPLIQAFTKQAMEEPILIVDETTFPVLELQGKGNRKKNFQAEDPKATNYVLAVSTPDNSDHRLFLFSGLKSRSAESIKEIITKDYKFKTLVTDGYSGYGRILQDDHPNAKHQSCLIHWRRTLLKAVMTDKVVEKFEKLPPQEQEALLEEKLRGGNVTPALVMVIDAIRKIYRLLSDAKWHPEHTEQNRVQIRMLMDTVDEIIKEISKDLLTQKGSKYTSKFAENRIAQACCYYMNNRDELRTFLDDSKVPCDSNQIECAIRTIAVIRRNTMFKQSAEYERAMLNIVSVVKTLEANGVTDVDGWLRAYSARVFQYICDMALTQAINKGLKPNKKLIGCDFKELAKDFDATPYLPWNNPFNL